MSGFVHCMRYASLTAYCVLRGLLSCSVDWVADYILYGESVFLLCGLGAVWTGCFVDMLTDCILCLAYALLLLEWVLCGLGN